MVLRFERRRTPVSFEAEDHGERLEEWQAASIHERLSSGGRACACLSHDFFLPAICSSLAFLVSVGVACLPPDDCVQYHAHSCTLAPVLQLSPSGHVPADRQCGTGGSPVRLAFETVVHRHAACSLLCPRLASTRAADPENCAPRCCCLSVHASLCVSVFGCLRRCAGRHSPAMRSHICRPARAPSQRANSANCSVPSV
jgi:hypothetical protein